MGFNEGITEAVAEYNDVVRRNAEAVTRADQAEADLRVAYAQIKALQERLDDSTSVTLFGACPSGGGTSLAAQRAPVLKYGHPCTVRQFHGTLASPRAPRNEVLRLHASWNLGSMKVDSVNEAWVEKVTANLLEGDEVEVIHEADKKVTDGKRTFEECVAYKNRFYDMVQTVRPDLFVINTLTGGSLSSYGGDREERWGAVRADFLGVDCDGVHNRTGSDYVVSYEDEMANAVKMQQKYGYEGIVVPEFGTSRTIAFDPDGEKRARWIRTQADIFRETKVRTVNAYEYNAPVAGNEFVPGTPEFEAWKALVWKNAVVA